jgi:hypothetical protein
MAADTEQEAKMYAECPDVCACLTRNPEHSEVAFFIKFQQFRFMDSANTKLPLHSRNEWRTLEESSCEGLQSTRKSSRIGKCRVQA